jgi:hypothetical protein
MYQWCGATLVVQPSGYKTRKLKVKDVHV